jgi:hypothetical protein
MKNISQRRESVARAGTDVERRVAVIDLIESGKVTWHDLLNILEVLGPLEMAADHVANCFHVRLKVPSEDRRANTDHHFWREILARRGIELRSTLKEFQRQEA